MRVLVFIRQFEWFSTDIYAPEKFVLISRTWFCHYASTYVHQSILSLAKEYINVFHHIWRRIDWRWAKKISRTDSQILRMNYHFFNRFFSYSFGLTCRFLRCHRKSSTNFYSKDSSTSWASSRLRTFRPIDETDRLQGVRQRNEPFFWVTVQSIRM